jgi:hypothetical protein
VGDTCNFYLFYNQPTTRQNSFDKKAVTEESFPDEKTKEAVTEVNFWLQFNFPSKTRKRKEKKTISLSRSLLFCF